jgi:hypothetical protein
MRIISKFHDYYDIGYHSGYPIFVRHTSDYTIGKIPFFDKELNDYVSSMNTGILSFPSAKHPVNMYVVGCCGKLYFIYTVSKNYLEKPVAYTDINKVLDVAYNGNKKLIDDVKYNSRMFRGIHTLYVDSTSQDVQKQFNDRFCNRNLDDIFIKIGSPLFIIPVDRHNKVFTVNPVLKDYGFQHIVDPYTMYQEIEMYLGNILVSDKKVPEFNDVLKRDMHGMNEWSFKKKGKGK